MDQTAHLNRDLVELSFIRLAFLCVVCMVSMSGHHHFLPFLTIVLEVEDVGAGLVRETTLNLGNPNK